jgi:hypothetical protein
MIGTILFWLIMTRYTVELIWDALKVGRSIWRFLKRIKIQIKIA